MAGAQRSEMDTATLEERAPDELMEHVANNGPFFMVDGDVPDLDVFAASVQRHLAVIGHRLAAVRETLDALRFSEVEVSTAGCLECQRRAGVLELEDAGGFLEAVQDGLASWFGAFNQSRLLILPAELWEVIRTLAERTESLSPIFVGIQAAVRHLAAADDPFAIIHKYERERVAAVKAAQAGREAQGDPDDQQEPEAHAERDVDNMVRPNSEAGQATKPNGSPKGDDDVADVDAVPMNVQLYYLEDGLGQEVDLDVPTIVAGFDRDRIRRELSELAARYSSRYHDHQLGYSVAVIPTDDNAKRKSDNPAEAALQPGRPVQTTTAGSVQAGSEDSKVPAGV